MWTLSNQFGNQTIITQDAVLLGVPTQKQPFGPAHDMDHFKFYNATGPAVSFTVNLVDQFHQELGVQVVQPRYFGNPVEKTHNDIDGNPNTFPINYPNDFLVCYDIPPQAFTFGVTVQNQFTNPILASADPAR